jgi:hypothetical protein
MTYTVNEWGSHPELGNDDCSRGQDGLTLEQARAILAAGVSDIFIEYLQLDGPDVHEVVKNPTYNARARAAAGAASDTEWRREIAMQAGMGLGVEAFNEEMGYE